MTPVVIWREHKKLSQYLNKVGRVLVWTKVHIAPEGFENQSPYLVGIIKFDDGTKLPLQIVETSELKPNQKVITVIRKIGKAKSEDVIEYGVKVKPRS